MKEIFVFQDPVIAVAVEKGHEADVVPTAVRICERIMLDATQDGLLPIERHLMDTVVGSGVSILIVGHRERFY